MPQLTKEAQILYDADKLDSLGAIGVARSYMWTGRNGAKTYSNDNVEDYIKENLTKHGRIKDKTKHSPQLEFETKLKHILDKLFTSKAKEIGLKRLHFQIDFMNRLEREVKGEI